MKDITFVDGHYQPNDLGAWCVEGVVECIPANETTKQSVIAKSFISGTFLAIATAFASHTIL